ncbi:MAG: alcohol dehydrogenase catalytic domain-containing protein [Rubrivivax sp.]
MEALVIHALGDLRVEAIETPPLGASQLPVRVRCGGICGSTCTTTSTAGFCTVRIKEPMVLGHEVAGVVEAAARRRSRAGDRIAVSSSRPCGLCRYSPARPAQPPPGHALLRQRDARRTCRARSGSRSW